MGYNNTYGIQYIGEFDSIPRNGGSSDRYFFNISKKNTSDNIQNVLCAASPAIHSYLNDEPKTYLKGSELEITLINKDGILPLSTFYSEEDDMWKIDFYVVLDIGFPPTKNQLLFSGYLTIENCTEILTDIAHEIKLVFTDNLGYLKQIKLADALIQTPQRTIPTETSYNTYLQVKQDANNIKYFQIQFNNFANWTGGAPEEGDSILIENNPSVNGYFTVASATQVGISLPITWDIYVVNGAPDVGPSAAQNPWFPTAPAGTQANITILKPYKKTDIVSLLDVYWILLYNTGIKLDFFFANMLQETSSTPPVGVTRMLEYIYISLDTFFDNNSSDDLDEIAKKLGYRFSSSLFQANGQWNLIRWNELRNTQEIVSNPSTLNKLNADWYSKNDFSWNSRIPITKTRNIGNGEDIEFGIEGSIFRPLKFIEHCYKYSQNDNVPFNGDLNTIGELISEQVIGTDTIKRYVAIGWREMWKPQVGWNYVTRYIEVVYDQFGNETDRYLVIDVSGGISDDRRSVGSEYLIAMNKGDKLNISFEWRTASSHSGNGTSFAAMPGLSTNPNIQSGWYYVGADGSWSTAMGNIGTYFNNDWNEWHTVSVETKPIPFDGVSQILLPRIVNPSETKTYIKNIKIEYKPYIAGQFANDGHCHKTTKYSIIKNNESEDIFIDDTEKNYSKGTLFLYSFTGEVRDRTQIWQDGVGMYASLGEIILRQEHIWRNKTRLKLEGNLFPIVINQGTIDVQNLSMLNVIDFLIDATKHLIFGKLELDYKMNQSQFTAYEMWRDGEIYWKDTGTQIVEMGANIDKDIKYTFKYTT